MRYEFSLYCDSVPERVTSWCKVYASRFGKDRFGVKTAIVCQEYSSDFVAVLIESGIPFSCRDSSGFRSSEPCRNGSMWNRPEELTADLPEPSEFSSCETDDLIRPVF